MKALYTIALVALVALSAPVAWAQDADVPVNALSDREIEAGWELLFDGTSLDGWQVLGAPEAFVIDDEGSLQAVGGHGGDIVTDGRWGDFVLSLEFKVSPGANSGVFYRVGEKNNPVWTGQEIQIYDSYANPNPGRNDCGSLYDCLAPVTNACRPANEWQTMSIYCRDAHVIVSMNGIIILHADLDQWTEANKNPDGSDNKFGTAYKDMPREGHIALQNHGQDVWYRNIKVLPLQ